MRVLGGPCAGRVGAVTELDGTGGARVTFGPMQAHVQLKDIGLVGELDARPAIHSSHRRFEVPSPAEAPKAGSGGSSPKGAKPGRRARST